MKHLVLVALLAVTAISVHVNANESCVSGVTKVDIFSKNINGVTRVSQIDVYNRGTLVIHDLGPSNLGFRNSFCKVRGVLQIGESLQLGSCGDSSSVNLNVLSFLGSNKQINLSNFQCKNF